MYYKQKEFAELCGKNSAHISKYISRGKIIRSGKVIDSDLPENIEFMKSCGVDVDGITPSNTQAEPVIEKPSPRSSPGDPGIDDPAVAETGQYSLTLQKTDADINLKNQRLILLQLEEARIRGDQIPTEMVRDLISRFSKSIINEYKDLADKFLIELMHKMKVSADMSAEIKGEMIKLINITHDKAITTAIKGIEDVVSNQQKAKK
ncbi:MAG: hypothetical protein KAU20_05440 [Nanoarchaeota archaeon]|nr:hypothetical protein [Nanoarchaeota archaeon]